MRCPYCGGLNPDEVDYCTICGRSLQPAGTPPPRSFTSQQQQTYPPAQRLAYPPNPSAGAPRTTVQQPQRQRVPPRVAPPAKTAPPPPRPPVKNEPSADTDSWSMFSPAASAVQRAPEPPAPFPPKTIAQLKALEQGALEYQQLSDDGGYGKKKIVRIQFRHCAPWQQVATLSKALREYDQASYNTVIIQGVYYQGRDVYEYNNGQLVFDRNVRLGGATLNRYQIETENGFSSDALRIVLSE